MPISKAIEWLLLTLFILLVNQNVWANKSDVRFSGFTRAAGAVVLNSAPDYLGRIDRDGDAGETQFGLNVHVNLGQGYQVAGQIWGAGVEGEHLDGNGPPVDRFHIALDWAFVSKQFSDDFSMKAGKIKYPNLLVSEYVDIGLAYPWVRPPEELYSFEAEGPYISMESFEGLSSHYVRQFGDSELNLMVYGGQSIVEDGHLEQMIGLKAVWSADNYSLLAGFNSHLMDTVGLERGAYRGEIASILNFGFTMDAANILIYSEGVTGNVGDVSIQAYYATLGYQFTHLLPHVTYADVGNTEGWGQSSIAAGLKYQLLSAVSLKTEWKYITPRRVEDENESGGFFARGLDGGVDSASIASVAIDVVF